MLSAIKASAAAISIFYSELPGLPCQVLDLTLARAAEYFLLTLQH
jgi:hypothetical protein